MNLSDMALKYLIEDIERSLTGIGGTFDVTKNKRISLGPTALRISRLESILKALRELEERRRLMAGGTGQ